MSTDKGISNNEKNGILVNRQLIGKVKSALTVQRAAMDRLPSDRVIIDQIIAEVGPVIVGNPVYCKVIPKREDQYLYFGSAKVDWLRSDACKDVRDLGRFVDACMIAYLWGDRGLHEYCIASRLIYPQKLDDEKRQRLQTMVAEIAHSQSVESKFVPFSHDLDSNVDG